MTGGYAAFDNDAVWGVGVTEEDARREADSFARASDVNGSIDVLPCTPRLRDAVLAKGGTLGFVVVGGSA